MAGVQSRDFGSPDETRTPDKTQVDIVRMGATTIGRFAFEPGWRWSECIKPVVGTDSCQVEHIGYLVSGHLQVQHGDGSTGDVMPGMVYRIAPDHDAHVVGDEPVVVVEFQGAATYAKH